jgi:predicted phosphodiesterase
MRLAILCDIHGNLPAFESAIAHAKQQCPDLIIIAGDIVTGSPDSLACWQLALTLNCPILRGNQERYVCELATDQAPPLWHTLQFAPVQWTRAQLGDELSASFADLSLSLRPETGSDLVVVHASLRNDTDNIWSYTPANEITPMFPNIAERHIIRGHNHFGDIRFWGERQIITAGSVGLPMDGTNTAQYLLLDRQRSIWHATHHALPYDHDAVIARFHDTNYLRETGPIGRLCFRELVTGTPHLVPFLRLYPRWRDENLGLDEAVQRFFQRY